LRHLDGREERFSCDLLLDIWLDSAGRATVEDEDEVAAAARRAAAPPLDAVASEGRPYRREAGVSLRRHRAPRDASVEAVRLMRKGAPPAGGPAESVVLPGETAYDT